MKKIKQLINTVYRICLVNPGGRKRYVNYREESGMETGLISDSLPPSDYFGRSIAT